MKLKAFLLLPALALTFLWGATLKAQTANANAAPALDVPLQPFAEQIQRLQALLKFYGQPLSPQEEEQIRAASAGRDSQSSVEKIENVLDRHVVAIVSISPESRVDVTRGAAPTNLVQDSVRLFLVKVINQAGVTAPLAVESPNSGRVYVPSNLSAEPAHTLDWADVRRRWADISMFNKPPLSGWLSGLTLEYKVLAISSRDSGQRAAKLSFNVGQGTQDVGFLDDVSILFQIAPTRSIKLHVFDADGRPTMASFTFKDSMGRIYPDQAKRLAPDFFFQPQVYRADGESIKLPPGSYTVTYTGGPEYIMETRKVGVTRAGPKELTFHLKRWIDPEKYGWYSGDDHIHPAGCAHYQNPTEGVSPADMERQVLGEHLNVGATLIWGPCWYYQSHFFQGRKDQAISTRNSILHYDMEVSGFPSSHAGHLVLLNLKSIQYPGAERIEDWPTWDLPVLRWAKSQGAVVGYAHSGFGLQVETKSLPNYVIPPFDGIGANEYIVDVTYPNTVDFISAGNTPYVWELNIWYQTLNVGFRTRLSGETDFPCIYDGRVGTGRTYVKFSGPFTYDNYTKSVKNGEAYVSDGRSHLMDFKVNGTEVGTHDSQVNLPAAGKVQVQLTTAAYLPIKPDPAMQDLPYTKQPYWDLERARIGATRKVPVEVIVDGEPVAKQEIVADGTVRKLNFDIPLSKSSWMAVRILASSHTDPIFILVGGKPIRPLRRSAEWCLRGVEQCWKQKSPLISARELPAAKAAYSHARAVYQELIKESSDE
ncbi:MAG: CehA/McbA family metallohydrolase [Acidobacteriaceae bacterium]